MMELIVITHVNFIRVSIKTLSAFTLLLIALIASNKSFAQDLDKRIPNGTEGEFFPKEDSSVSVKKKKPWNELHFRRTTIRIGAGLLYEYAAYAQDQNSKIQSDSGGYSLSP